MDRSKIEQLVQNRAAEELYFIAISLILAFGILQTTGAALETDRPVVSVVSCSMYPQLHVGDILVVEGQNFDSIKEGDIVVYSSKEAKFTVDGESYQLTGYKNSKRVKTAAGELSLLNIQDTSSSPQGGGTDQPQAAIIKLDDRKLKLVEGKTYQLDGTSVTVDSVEGVSIPIVHRVVEKNDNYLETKGDNNEAQLSFEDNVTSEQIHGTSLFVVPRVGGLKLLLMDIVGFNGDKPFVIDSYPSCTERT